jgi:NAD(P)-dependent dehydrogenase (short-subunit alcohol dehydrogenase family)
MNLNVLITGANRGIGLALVERYHAQGNQVYAVCRSSSDELRSLLGVEIIDGVDVTKDQDLFRVKEHLGDIKLDILINNAGIMSDEELGGINFEAVQLQFSINAIGPLKTTQTLLNNLSDGSKVVLVTSRMGSIADNGSGGYYGYRMSKAALNAAGMSLARDLKPMNISVAMLHPGFVKTALFSNEGNISADDSALHLTRRIEQLSQMNTGVLQHANGELLPW